jgi:hypothetical protein
MSNELTVAYPGDASTIYAIIRRRSDYKVWSAANSAFETWADGNIDDYDVALTAKGGDIYADDMPAAVTAGTRLLVSYYIQAGASPAITDYVIERADLYWSGQDVTEGDTVSLASGNLTTLASLKRLPGIPASGHDDLLTELINAVSDRIKRICGRDLVATDYREWIDGDREQSVTIKNWPIIRVDRIAYGRDNGIELQYTGSDIRAMVVVYESGVRLQSIAADGTTSTTSLTFATYPTMSTMATAINAVSDWSASVKTDAPSADMHPLAGMDAKTRAVYLTFPDVDDYPADVNYDAGIIEFRKMLDRYDDTWESPQPRIEPTPRVPRGFRNLLVQYRGGYETIPDDIARAANELIVSAFALKPGNIQTESIDNYSYTLANQAEITDHVMSLLRPYMELR